MEVERIFGFILVVVGIALIIKNYKALVRIRQDEQSLRDFSSDDTKR